MPPPSPAETIMYGNEPSDVVAPVAVGGEASVQTQGAQSANQSDGTVGGEPLVATQSEQSANQMVGESAAPVAPEASPSARPSTQAVVQPERSSQGPEGTEVVRREVPPVPPPPQPPSQQAGPEEQQHVPAKAAPRACLRPRSSVLPVLRASERSRERE
eukprot:4402405-Alexandrium_andersonii.AAC.1